MTRDCLYCRLQFSDTTKFCPNCGRLIEKDFKIRPRLECELDYLRWELKEKEDLTRQLVLIRTMRGKASHAAASSNGRHGICGSDGRRARATARSSGRR
jgi:hypothetical protein